MAETQKNVVVRIVRSGGSNMANSSEKQVLQVALPKSFVVGTPNGNLVNSRTSDHAEQDAPLSKNAILARQNRLKKKGYIKGLEENLRKCKEENEELKKQVAGKDAEISGLKSEIGYLRSVLANNKEISSLLQTIRQKSKMRLSTSLEPPSKRSRVSESFSEPDVLSWTPESPGSSSPDRSAVSLLSQLNDEDLTLSNSSTGGKGGVCLHVCNERVSLEFCYHCSQSAEENWASEESAEENWNLASVNPDVIESWELGPAVNPEALLSWDLEDTIDSIVEPIPKSDRNSSQAIVRKLPD